LLEVLHVVDVKDPVVTLLLRPIAIPLGVIEGKRKNKEEIRARHTERLEPRLGGCRTRVRGKGHSRKTSVPRVSVLLLFLVTLPGLILALAGSAQADTLTVTNINNTGSGSLRSAIETADASGVADTITFAADLGATIKLTSGPLTINSDLTIKGPGAHELSVSGTGNSGVFSVASGATAKIKGLTITGGNADSGGGINNKGTLMLATAR